MENASKALYMAGTTLIAILIITIMVYLFSSASNVGETYQSKEETLAINAFNAKFNYLDSGVESASNYELLNKASDVATALNLAYDINEKNNYDELNSVSIYVYNQKSRKLIIGLDNNNEISGTYGNKIKDVIDKLLKDDLMESNNGTEKRYSGKVEISSLTGKVNKVTFELSEFPTV